MKLVRLVLGSISTNCYLLKNENTSQITVIDPADDADEILSAAGQLEGTVTGILLTHGHFDHIGAADELRSRTGAVIWAHREEEKILEDPAFNLSGGYGRPLSLCADRYAEDGMEIETGGFSFRVLFTPGHTAGGCCYYLEEEKLVFSGDTLFELSIGRTDFPSGSMKQLQRSIREKLFVLPEDTWVLPGHGGITKIGTEKQENPFFGD